MKRILFLKLLHILKSKPDLARKVKLFALVGLTGLATVFGLAIWAGISAFDYAAVKVKTVVESPVFQANVGQIDGLSCWNKTQSLLTVQPWLERPALENFINLKETCLKNRQLIHTTEGGTT